MNIVLFGPPGAGKGTQADNLVKAYNLFKISTGDLLRKEARNNTPLGTKIKNIIDKGLFVSDDIINNLVEKLLRDAEYKNQIIFDGYPRNLTQAKNLSILLEKYKQKIFCVLNLNVKKEIIIKRLNGRQTCKKCGLIFNEYFNPSTPENHTCDSSFLVKRSDDNEKTILNRYETYLEKTLPILDFYKGRNLLHDVNGDGSIDQIFEEIRSIIASLQA